MLCTEVTHKILRTDSVYDYLQELSRKSRNYTSDAIKELVGEIVLTRYVCRVTALVIGFHGPMVLLVTCAAHPLPVITAHLPM